MLLFLDSEGGLEYAQGLRLSLSIFFKATKTSTDFGSRWKESAPHFLSKASPWPHACLLSRKVEWAEFSKDLPQSGMASSGTCYPLETELRPMAKMDWLTICVGDAGKSGSAEAWEEYLSDHSSARLRNQVVWAEKKNNLWPTPTRNDAAGNRNIIQMQAKRNSLGLAEAVRCYPSGEAGIWSPVPKEVAEKAITAILNPDWVEWLMGFPQGWSKADPRLTAKIGGIYNASTHGRCRSSADRHG